MKEVYITAEMEIIEFENEDVITASITFEKWEEDDNTTPMTPYK